MKKLNFAKGGDQSLDFSNHLSEMNLGRKSVFSKGLNYYSRVPQHDNFINYPSSRNMKSLP